MRWLKAVFGVAVLGAFAYGVVQYRNGSLKLPFVPLTAAAVTPQSVEAGTPLVMILLTPLDSGATKVGDTAKLVVSEPVKSASGDVLIAEGAMVTAKVVESRGGTLAGSLTNRPARLSVTFTDVEAVDGRRVPLKGMFAEGDHRFDQSNTTQGTANMAGAVNDAEARKFVEGTWRRMLQGERLGPAEQAKLDAELSQIAERYGLESTRQLLDTNKAKRSGQGVQLEKVLAGDLGALAAPEAALAIKALGELGSLFGGVDDTLRGVFKGSNIHARVGTVVKARVKSDVRVTPRPKA